MSDFKVMLAHPYGKKEFNTDSFIQPKLDGVRCYITKNGAFSRNHKEFKTVDHIKDAFKPLFKKTPALYLENLKFIPLIKYKIGKKYSFISVFIGLLS